MPLDSSILLSHQRVSEFVTQYQFSIYYNLQNIRNLTSHYFSDCSLDQGTFQKAKWQLGSKCSSSYSTLKISTASRIRTPTGEPSSFVCRASFHSHAAYGIVHADVWDLRTFCTRAIVELQQYPISSGFSSSNTSFSQRQISFQTPDTSVAGFLWLLQRSRTRK